MRKRNTPSVEVVVVACDLSTVRTIVQGRQRTMYSTPETPFSLLTFDCRRLAVVQQEGPSKCPLQVPWLHTVPPEYQPAWRVEKFRRGRSQAETALHHSPSPLPGRRCAICQSVATDGRGDPSPRQQDHSGHGGGSALLPTWRALFSVCGHRRDLWVPSYQMATSSNLVAGRERGGIYFPVPKWEHGRARAKSLVNEDPQILKAAGSQYFSCARRL